MRREHWQYPARFVLCEIEHTITSMLVAHMANTLSPQLLVLWAQCFVRLVKKSVLRLCVCVCVPGSIHHQVMNYHANFIGKHASCPFSTA